MLSDPTLKMSIQGKILDILKEKPMYRSEIVQKLNTQRTTIYDNLFKLLKQGKVERSFYHNNRRGRPWTIWRLRE